MRTKALRFALKRGEPAPAVYSERAASTVMTLEESSSSRNCRSTPESTTVCTIPANVPGCFAMSSTCLGNQQTSLTCRSVNRSRETEAPCKRDSALRSEHAPFNQLGREKKRTATHSLAALPSLFSQQASLGQRPSWLLHNLHKCRECKRRYPTLLRLGHSRTRHRGHLTPHMLRTFQYMAGNIVAATCSSAAASFVWGFGWMLPVACAVPVVVGCELLVGAVLGYSPL